MEREVIKSNIQGIQRILEITESNRNDGVCLTQFSNMDENLCAVLGAFHKGELISIKTGSEPPIKFKNNLFVRTLCPEAECEKNIGKNVIPYFEIEKNDYNTQNQNVLDYIQHYILLTEHVPTISEQVKNLLQDAILEFFSNAFIHTECERVYACGRWDQTENMFHLTIVNIGKTFQENVAEYLHTGVSSKEAIKWAMVRGNTTKKGDSGGLGLSVITEFVEKNEGEFLLISGDGALCRHGNTPCYEDINVFFPGTFVNLVFNLKDTKQYVKTDENRSTVNFKW